MAKTTPRGIAALKAEEGEVLKAYRCPAGRLTIGVGLTAASGVIDPRPGMVITREESDRLLSLALERNYEPAVAVAMARGNASEAAKPHEFDAGVGFHFNTGAIARASWVKAWKVGDWVETHRRLRMWTKGGGKVLPGLKRRREREFDMMKMGDYGVPAETRPAAPVGATAKLAPPITAAEVPAIREALRKLGYPVDNHGVGIAAEAVRAFQRDHDLTDDGIIGRATAATLQRVLDARRKAAAPATGAAAGGAASAAPASDSAPGEVLAALPWLGPALMAGAAVYGLILLWRYRDTVAAAVQRPLPRLAAKLRSF